MIEIAVFASNMQVIISTATALQIITGVSSPICVVLSSLDALVFLVIHYKGAKNIEFVFIGLMAIMTVMFLTNMIVSAPDMKQLALGAVTPQIPAGSFAACLGLAGSVMMPGNLYLQSTLVLGRKVNYRNRTEINEGNVYNRIESALSLGTAMLVNICVIATFAVFSDTHRDQKDLTLYSAADALS